MDLQGVAILITGGASGLGAGAAKVLSDAGAKVGLLDRNLELAEKVAAELGGVAAECDVTDTASLEAAIAKTRESIGVARVILNCAGIDVAIRTANRKQPHPLDEFQRVIDVNLTGTFDASRLAANEMLSLDTLEGGERGVIVNVASMVAFDGPLGQSAYAASKMGVAGMTLPMARDLAPYGIRVVSIAPGMFETPLATSVPDQWLDEIIPTIPFPNRWGNPLEFGALVKHICENPMLNGETIRIDAAVRLGVQ